MAEDSLAYFQNCTNTSAGRCSDLYWFMGGLHEVRQSTFIRNFTYQHMAAFIRSRFCELIRTPAWEFYFYASSGIMNKEFIYQILKFRIGYLGAGGLL